MNKMKSLIYVLIIASLHTSWSIPVAEEVKNLKDIFLPSLTDVKFFDIKSEPVNIPPSGPSVAKTEAVKEPATAEKIIAKEEKSEDVLKPGAIVVGDQPIKASESLNIVPEAGKTEVDPLAQLENERSDQLNVKEELVCKTEESRKESNNLISSVLVNEPKPLQNEIRSDVHNADVKIDSLKSDVPASLVKQEEANPDNVASNEAQIKHEIVKDEAKLKNVKDEVKTQILKAESQKIEVQTDKKDSKEDETKHHEKVSVVSVLDQVKQAEPILKVDASRDQDVPKDDKVKDILKPKEENKIELKPLSSELSEKKREEIKNENVEEPKQI